MSEGESTRDPTTSMKVLKKITSSKPVSSLKQLFSSVVTTAVNNLFFKQLLSVPRLIENKQRFVTFRCKKCTNTKIHRLA